MATVIASTPQEKRGMAYQKSAYPWAHISCGMLSPSPPFSLYSWSTCRGPGLLLHQVSCLFPLAGLSHLEAQVPTNLVCHVSYSPACEGHFSSQSSFPFGVFLLKRVVLCSPWWSPSWVAQAVLELRVNLSPRPPEYWDYYSIILAKRWLAQSSVIAKGSVKEFRVIVNLKEKRLHRFH